MATRDSSTEGLPDPTDPGDQLTGTALGRAAFRALSQGVVVHASDGRILQVNQAAEDILGLSAAQMAGATPTDPRWHAVHQDGSPFPGDTHPVTEALASGAEVRDVVMGVHKSDGRLSWLWVNAIPVEGEPKENEAAVVVTFTDVTELVDLRTTMKASEEHYRLLADNSVDVIVRTGPDRMIDWVSPSVLSVLGWEPEDWIGRGLTDFVHPDDIPTGIDDGVVTLKGGLRRGRGEMRVSSAAGRWRWMNSIGRALVDDDGTLVGGIDCLRDITAEMAARDELRASEEHYRLLAENSTDVVVRVRDGVIVWVSPSLTAALGWAPEEWTGRPGSEFIHPDDFTDLRRVFGSPTGGASGRVRRRLRSRNGTYHWVESNFSPYVDNEGRPDGVIAALRIVDAEVEVQVELDRRVRHDDLTGLLNRAEVIDRLSAMLVHPRRAGREIAVAFCDIDDFKSVNDRFGHGAGDEALRTLAARISAVVREDDLVARFGGDEILVVLPGLHELGQAAALADKFRAQALLPIPILGGSFEVSLSIGVTLAHPDESPDSLIARADDAMYEAKVSGKDRVVAIPEHHGR